MQYTAQVDANTSSLWSFIACQFPDVHYINTPFWPVYIKEEVTAFLQDTHQDHCIPFFDDLDPEDQNRLMQMASFLEEGAQGETDPPDALAEEYWCLTLHTYEEHAEDYRKAIVQHTSLDNKLIEFSRLIGPQGTIIDIGCGPGHDILKFLAQGKNIVGLDASSAMVRLAHEITHVRIYHMDLRSLTLPDQCVKGIWCNATLLHLPRKTVPQALQEFNRILQLPGYLYISVKQGTGSCLVRREKTGGSPRFFTYFSKREMAQYLDQARFDLSETIRFVTYRQGIGWDAWINILARKRNI